MRSFLGCLTTVTRRDVDFEVHDALDILERFGCVCTTTEHCWRAQPMEQVLRDLDLAWDNYFLYNHSDDDDDRSPRGQSDCR